MKMPACYAVRGHGRLLAVMELPAETEWHQIHKKEKLLCSVLENLALAMEQEFRLSRERMRDREKMEQERYRAISSSGSKCPWQLEHRIPGLWEPRRCFFL